MRSMIHTSASLLLKVAYESGEEKLIGYAKNLQYTVSQGQKMTYVVDSIFPEEIAQGAAPSFIKGSLTIFLPKGTTPESLGLVPYRTKDNNNFDPVPAAALSKHLHFRIYDRSTLNLVMSLDWCKVSSYSLNMSAKGIVEVNMQFDGKFATPGIVI